MATRPVTTGAPTRANVIAFPSRHEPLAYAPGVDPFDRSNPAHVSAWNTLFAFGRGERARIEREGC